FLMIVQMGFLLPAVVAAEAKGGLKRSHDLTRGNIWRVAAIALALVLPVLFLVIAAAAVILSSALGPDFGPAPVTPEVMQRAENAINQQLLPWEILNAVIFVLFSGLVYSGAALAYLAVTGKGDHS